MATVPTGATTATIPVLDPDQADLALAVTMSKTATTEQHASKRAGPRRIAGMVLLLLASLTLAIYLLAWQDGQPIGREEQGLNLPEDEDPDTPGEIEPIVQPDLVPAKEAKLADDEMMITIEVGGQHQAYWIRDLSQPGSHVVNDMVGGLAISITYCDQTDFARVFSDPETDKPLKLRTAGWMKKQLALQVGSPENIHLHDDKMIPLDDYPFVRVPFGQWRSEHPDGLVYVGGIDWEAGEETRSEK